MADKDRFHHFKLVQPEALPRGKGFLLEMDGQPLKGVTKLALDSSATDVTRVVITFLAGSINFEGLVTPIVNEEDGRVDDPPTYDYETEGLGGT